MRLQGYARRGLEEDATTRPARQDANHLADRRKLAPAMASVLGISSSESMSSAGLFNPTIR